MEDIRKALDNRSFQEGVSRAAHSAEVNVPKILSSNPHIVEMAKEVKKAKERVIANLDYYIEQAVESLKAVQAKPYLAKTPEEAKEYILGMVGSSKTIVLSKSMVAEEIGLRGYLEENGNEVWETDLGQLLVQLEHGKPMHTTAPAIHLTRERVAILLREKLGAELSESDPPEKMVRFVRRFLREKFTKANVGISGANAIAADTGAIFLVENEGNIKLVTGLPEKHIVVAGIEKILPTALDAFKTVLVQAAYAGLYPPTYLNIIAGPSSTADIEHTRVYGAHGPLELHVVLIDNGRKKAAEHPFLKEQLRCIRCGRCQYECPVWRHTANLWGGPAYGGPMGINWTAITLSEEVASGLAVLCLNCRRCNEVCPVEIPLSDIISKLKVDYSKRIK
ncbi:MAG: lactate utilization protein [Desulfurococcales archaeon]|nr:lactate utilization protein [Desulfurococcales archaeon]